MIISYSDFVNKFLWRNNVIKGYLVFSFLMSVSMNGMMLFIFYYLNTDESKIFNFVMPLQLLFGSVTQFYGSYFAYVCSVILPLDLQRIDLKKVLLIIFRKLILFQFFVFIVPTIIFYNKFYLFVKLIEIALFNMGIASFIMLLLSVSSDSYISIHYNKLGISKNKKYFSVLNLILFPMVACLIWIDNLLTIYLGGLLGHSIIIILEVSVLMAYPIFVFTANNHFVKLRYRKLNLYFSLN